MGPISILCTEDEGGAMNLARLFKTLGDESRLSIVRSLAEKDLYAEVLAERLSLAPGTITHHLKKLEAVGLISSKKEQYYKVFSLKKSVVNRNMLDLILDISKDSEDKKENIYEQKIIKSFLKRGILTTIPVQRKKRLIILKHLLKEFEAEVEYTEAEVNKTLIKYHEDYCTLRREFIAERLMSRTDGLYSLL